MVKEAKRADGGTGLKGLAIDAKIVRQVMASNGDRVTLAKSIGTNRMDRRWLVARGRVVAGYCSKVKADRAFDEAVKA